MMDILLGDQADTWFRKYRSKYMNVLLSFKRKGLGKKQDHSIPNYTIEGHKYPREPLT